jgi:hypothetical protein
VRISIENYVLVDGSIEWELGMVVNGTKVTDEAGLFRALSETFYDRGNKSTSITFSVRKQFGSRRRAEVFQLTHYGEVPGEGRIEFECGDVGDEQTVSIEGGQAVATSVSRKGVDCIVQYQLVGGLPTTDALDPLPTPEEGEDDIVIRRATVALANGATAKLDGATPNGNYKLSYLAIL